jgi:hypothetical protein
VKRRGRPAKVKSEIVTLDSITNADVIAVPKKRGPKPGAKYKKTATNKTRVSKSPKAQNIKSVSVESSNALINVHDSPKKRGPKPGAKYKKATTKKTRVTKAAKVKSAKIDNAKPVSAKTSEVNSAAKDSSKKRGPKPGAKYIKRAIVAKPSIETIIDSTVVKNEKSTSKKPILSKAPKAAKKVSSVKSSEVVSEVVDSKPTAINNEIKALKLTVTKLTKPKAVKVTNAVVVKQPKAKAVKVNNSAKKSPVSKVKSPVKVVSKDASIEPKA